VRELSQLTSEELDFRREARNAALFHAVLAQDEVDHYAPRVYFAMARDGMFFRGVGYVSPRSRAPVVAIAVQGVWASVIALSGKYEQILNYVVALDAVFFGLTGAALVVLRRRDPVSASGGFRMPGHPWTTMVFVGAFWALAVNTVIQNPRSAGIGVLILLAGVPAYFFWRRRAA